MDSVRDSRTERSKDRNALCVGRAAATEAWVQQQACLCAHHSAQHPLFALCRKPRRARIVRISSAASEHGKTEPLMGFGTQLHRNSIRDGFLGRQLACTPLSLRIFVHLPSRENWTCLRSARSLDRRAASEAREGQQHVFFTRETCRVNSRVNSK